MRKNLSALIVFVLVVGACKQKETSANVEGATKPVSTASTASPAAPVPVQKAQAATLAPNAHILITGIASIFHKATATDPVTQVIFPSVGQPKKAHSTGDAIPPHVAFIAVDTQKFSVDTKLIGTSIGHHTVYFLSGSVDIVVQDLQGIATPPVETPEDGTQGHHTIGNLYYIPHLANINHKQCIPANIGFNARFDTPTGTLASYVTHSSVQDFIDPPGDTPIHSQCVADVADWSFTVGPAADGTSQLVLQQRKIGLSQLMKITHAIGGDTAPIVVVIGNANNVNVSDAIGGNIPVPMGRDPHFDIYYDRCKDLVKYPIPYDRVGGSACVVDSPLPPYFPDWITKGQRFNVLLSTAKGIVKTNFNMFMVGGSNPLKRLSSALGPEKKITWCFEGRTAGFNCVRG
jgi:hypothetical protein